MKNRASNIRVRAGIAVGIGVALTIAGGSAAHAATSRASTDLPNCAYIVPIATTVCTPVGQDLHKAVLEKTGYTVVDPSTANAAGAAKQASTNTAASVFVLAKLYDDRNLSGANFEVDGGGGCTSAVIGVGDASLPFAGATSYVGDTMNDRTKSVQVTR